MKEPGARDIFFTRSFLSLNAILFLSYCNIAVFFHFHEYLRDLQIPAQYHGTLIALFSLVILVVRPLVSPFLNPGNACRWLALSCAALIPLVMLYGFAQTIWSIAAVRMAHGAAYAVMATALTGRLVACIPADRSAQAFGIVSVMTLLPYAVLPPLLTPLTQWAGSYDRVLEFSALPMLAVFTLLPAMKNGVTGAGERQEGRLNGHDILNNLRNPAVLAVLGLSLIIWTTFTPVFFFLQSFGEGIGIANPGWFFTLSTLTEILVRLLAGPLFDRMAKARLLTMAMAWLGLGYVALFHLRGELLFYAMGLFMGLGWGVALPVLSGLVFDVSEPRLRALNTNLSMVMFQGGFFLGPLAGGALLAHWGFNALFYGCAALQLVAVGAGLMLSAMRKAERVLETA